MDEFSNFYIIDDSKHGNCSGDDIVVDTEVVCFLLNLLDWAITQQILIKLITLMKDLWSVFQQYGDISKINDQTKINDQFFKTQV